MARTKNTHTKKKSSKRAAKARPLTWKFYVTTVGIFLIAVTTVVVMSLFAAQIVRTQQAQARLERIQAIYASLELDQDTYRVIDANVFGDKRPYDWDKSRTYSSVIWYAHGDTVTNTFQELDEKIRAAGFDFIDEPYPGLSAKQYHYKSPETGAYIRLTVESKVYTDALFNALLMNQPTPSASEQSPAVFDQAPAKVTIKVNLDDNNE